MKQVARIELIAPNERTGLTPKHLRKIGEFLDACETRKTRGDEKGTLTP